MILIVVILFMLTSMLAIVSNEDIFSPSKLFLFLFLSFYVGAVFSDINDWTATLVLVVLFVGLMAVMFEADRLQRYQKRARPIVEWKPSRTDHTVFLWTVSLPSLFAQLYMIDYFGGIEGYVNSVSLRVSEWAGLGWARSLIALLTPINLVYFALGLAQRRSARWWMPYAVHFMILLAIAVMSGSRSSLLNIFAMQIIIFHYLWKPVKARQAVLLAGGLVLAAMALGVMRESIRFNEGELVTISASSERTLSFASLYYGVEPLEIITRTEYPPLAGGTTFISLFTNAIPRTVWPNKPETGGVFFTKNYTNDAWLGYSNLSPTFLGEWIINFGWAIGVVGFVVCYFILIAMVINYYYRTAIKLGSNQSSATVIGFVIYVQVMWAMMALMVGETTNTILGLVLTQLIPLWLMKLYVSRFSR